MIKELILSADFLAAQGFSHTIVERFWAKVDCNGPIPVHRPELGPCWIWTAYRNAGGYGCISKGGIRGETIKAHVLSWILHNGPVPADKPCICHDCDNRPCVNPAHLWPGTLGDNNRDAAGKERIGVLTWEQIAEIRRRYRPGNRYHPSSTDQEKLAAEYGVSRPHISEIVNFKHWS